MGIYFYEDEQDWWASCDECGQMAGTPALFTPYSDPERAELIAFLRAEEGWRVRRGHVTCDNCIDKRKRARFSFLSKLGTHNWSRFSYTAAGGFRWSEFQRCGHNGCDAIRGRGGDDSRDKSRVRWERFGADYWKHDRWTAFEPAPASPGKSTEGSNA